MIYNIYFLEIQSVSNLSLARERFHALTTYQLPFGFIQTRRKFKTSIRFKLTAVIQDVSPLLTFIEAFMKCRFAWQDVDITPIELSFTRFLNLECKDHYSFKRVFDYKIDWKQDDFLDFKNKIMYLNTFKNYCFENTLDDNIIQYDGYSLIKKTGYQCVMPKRFYKKKFIFMFKLFIRDRQFMAMF